jgi:hypothetical protein
MNIFRYLYLLLLLIYSLYSSGQNDTLFHRSLRIGADVSGFARQLLEPEIIYYELHADMEWTPNWFMAAEIGLLDVNINKPTHDYFAGGYFLRAGFDYNLLQRPDIGQIGIAYGSLRYGFSNTNHEAPEIIISNVYWGEVNSSIPAENIWSHWFELGGGLKTKLFGNVYVGWSLRARFLLYKSRSISMEPYYIAGFGKYKDKPSVMVHYSIYYRLF